MLNHESHDRSAHLDHSARSARSAQNARAARSARSARPFRRLALALALVLAVSASTLLASCSQTQATVATTATSLPAATVLQSTAGAAPAGSQAGAGASAATPSNIAPATATASAPAAVPAASAATAGTTAASPSPSAAASLPAGEAPSAAHPAIALTFDDGPSLRDTGKLLDLLKAEQVTATFFVLGNQIGAGRQDILKRTASEGHEIGNHTYTHLTLRKAGADKVREEFAKTSSLIAQVTGRKPTIARPPTGAYDDTTIAVAQELGLALVNWSYQSCPEDWNHRGEPQYIADFVISKAANGHIVLLHDTNSSTVEAMPAMIKGLKARGFRFMTVSQLLAWSGAGEPAPGKVHFQLAMKK